jgi:hypothetical protein
MHGPVAMKCMGRMPSHGMPLCRFQWIAKQQLARPRGRSASGASLLASRNLHSGIKAQMPFCGVPAGTVQDDRLSYEAQRRTEACSWLRCLAYSRTTVFPFAIRN